MDVKIIIIIITFLFFSCNHCKKDRYLTYTVNSGEGFNLRRDVYMRSAILIYILNKATDYNWVLVLPPWPRLYHWKSSINQSRLPWSKFFDIESLSKFVPTTEFSQYIEEVGGTLDHVVVLQKLKEAFADGGTWIETAVEENCRVKLRYQLNSDKLWEGQFFGYENVQARKLTCLSVQGRISVLKSELIRMAKYTRSFLVENFEQLLHEEFGSVDYWKARRSMVYVGELRQVGNQFMIDELDYNPGDGVGRSRPNDGGGAYLSVHLRRQDYARAKPHQVPSLEGVASQIKILRKEQKLKAVFIATDAPLSEKRQLKKLIGGKVVWLDPSDELISRHGDGGVAIIDQWIAAHSKYFIGTIESTFSFRIREDRQFMKFPIEDTFNDLCGPTNDEFDPHSCPTPSKWLLVEDQSHDEL